VLFGVFRIGIVVRLIVESCELPLLERISIVGCHAFASRGGMSNNAQGCVGFPTYRKFSAGTKIQPVIKSQQSSAATAQRKTPQRKPRGFPVLDCDD
tara:strand:- start:72 stop:362 length:291 start_codon:yes stop_codon:yes gene_type:complete